MAQVKKPGMREAILEAAFDLFSRKGYTATTMTEIARAASMTVANLYVYFDSKILILYEIYRPWLVEQLTALRESVDKYRSPRTRLRRIFIGIWGDIPGADHCFANALIEALAAAPEGLGKPGNLLEWSEEFLTQLIIDSLPPERQHIAEGHMLSHVVWMAFDGFAVNQRIGDVRNVEAIADLLTNLLLGVAGADLEPSAATHQEAPSRSSAAQKKASAAAKRALVNAGKND